MDSEANSTFKTLMKALPPSMRGYKKYFRKFFDAGLKLGRVRPSFGPTGKSHDELK